MNPYTGETYAVREELLGDADVGDKIDMAEMRERVESLHDRLASELQAAEQQALVRVTEEVATKVKLGEREQERRRVRRKASRAARKRNR